MKKKKSFIFLSHLFVRRIKNRYLALGLMTALLLLTSLSGYSQITLTLRNLSLRESLKKIEQVSNYKFFYNENLPELNWKVSIKEKNANIDKTMSDVLSSTNLSYKKETGNLIVLVRRDQIEQRKQNRRAIRGKVIDVDGNPVIGASVTEKDYPQNGAISDYNGEFSLTPKNSDIIKISFVGYDTQTLKATPDKNLVVRLLESSNNLKEVVVIGYGSLDKREVTSSISSIKGSDLSLGVGGATVATAMQGKIPGLVIAESSSPNSDYALQLRGVASVNASQAPLVVIDGIPGGDIRSLNQSDIKSIDVLKDASAGAIYGTRAAGGVILITTKQAQTGRIKLTYTGEISTETIRKKPEVLSAADYIANGAGDDFKSDTNWYNELLNDNPISYNHVINLSGGNKDLLVYSTLSMQKQKGIAIGDDRKDYMGRVNTIYNMFDGKVKISSNIQYREAKRDNRISSDTFNEALALNPTIPLMNPDSPNDYNVIGNGISGTDFNPVADVKLRSYDGKDQWLLSDVSLKVNLTDDWFIQGTLGYEKLQWTVNKYWDSSHKSSVDNSRRGEAYQGYSKDERLSTDLYSTYHKTFGGAHDLLATLGYSFWQSTGESFNMTNYDFPIDGIGAWDMSSGTWLSDGRASMDSYKDPRERLLSFFARINYSYKDLYMLTASLRHEGSSKFGENHRWGNFWAVSAGWRISNESFMKNVKFVNDLKLRVGYGVTGNNGFGSGYTVRMYKSDTMWPINGVWNSSYGSSKNVNPDLKWEKNAELNIGLDYSIFDNRIYGKIDWYSRRVSDMLYEVAASMPPMTHSSVMKNIGNLKGRGWEFEINADIIRNDNLKYTTSLNLSHNFTKLLNIGLGDNEYIDAVGFPSPGSPGTGARLQNNLRIGQFFTYKNAGVDDKGNWLIYDKDNNVVTADSKSLVAANKRFTGNAIPKLMMAWSHRINYKNFDLSILLRSWLDFDIFNQVNMYYGLINKSQTNVLKSAYNKNKNITAEKILSDYWVEDGSFLKIDAVTLGYKLNLQQYTKYIDNVRFYLTVHNLAVITNYSGINPEVNITGLYPGFDYIKDADSMYPQTTRFTLGAQITF